MRERPAHDASVCAGADQDAVVGADLHAGDAAAVSYADMGHLASHEVPDLHQFVIPTWHQS